MQYANPDTRWCEKALKRKGHVLKYCHAEVGKIAKELYSKGTVLEILKDKHGVYSLYINGETNSKLMSYSRNVLNDKILIYYHTNVNTTIGNLFSVKKPLVKQVCFFVESTEKLMDFIKTFKERKIQFSMQSKYPLYKFDVYVKDEEEYNFIVQLVNPN